MELEAITSVGVLCGWAAAGCNPSVGARHAAGRPQLNDDDCTLDGARCSGLVLPHVCTIAIGVDGLDGIGSSPRGAALVSRCWIHCWIGAILKLVGTILCMGDAEDVCALVL